MWENPDTDLLCQSGQDLGHDSTALYTYTERLKYYGSLSKPTANVYFFDTNLIS
jgi:hypothetical protein